MRNRTLDREALLIQRLELLVVLGLRVHLNFEGKNFEEKSAAPLIVKRFVRFADLVKGFQDLRQSTVLFPVKPEFRELEVRLGPQTL